MSKPLLASIEAGGTKFNVAVGYEQDRWLKELCIKTEAPSVTLSQCAEFLQQAESEFGALAAIGVAAFGPINLKASSTRYGTILNTPKVGWSNVNLFEYFSAQFSCPVSIDTDVNAAALAEYHRRNTDGNLVYVTVGTGVGVGVCIDGHTLRGQLHPELGHLSVDRLANEKDGVCVAHGACIEGLISGPALKKRWNVELESVTAAHPLWQSSGYYLARLCSAITLAYSPNRIVVGGGVTQSGFLLPPTQKIFTQIMACYLPDESFPDGIESLIDRPMLDDSAGIVGAFLLAENKRNES